MKNLALIGKIKEIYDSGENVMESLKKEHVDLNDVESIMISYDLQAGSYTKLAKKNSVYLDHYTNAIKSTLSDLSEYSSIMEIGVGEATLMNPLMTKIDPNNKVQKFGFDISWSRTRYAMQNTQIAGNAIKLFTANLFEIPLPNNAIDIVYTSHSLEPNGGKEKEALKELYRVANKYIVLLEPDFDRATSEGKERMTRYGYVRDLAKQANELGYEVLVDRSFDVSINPLNPTGLIVIRKSDPIARTMPSFICPVTKAELKHSNDAYFSAKSGLIYPIIDGIPCLLKSAAILGLHFSNFCPST